MPKRFRSHKLPKIPKGIIIPIKPDKVPISTDIVISNGFSLSDNERIRYIYTKDNLNKISNIICASYDHYMNGEWITITYYDSEHGSLHRHQTISYEDRNYLITRDEVKKSGTKEEWLTWAINDLKKRHSYYLKLFLKRSNFNFDKRE